MSDLISREDVLHELGWCDYGLKDWQKWKLKMMVRDIPTAQPERKKGKWILHENQRQEDVDNGNYLYVCSECGKSDIHAKTQEVPFCWWCGSEMREE